MGIFMVLFILLLLAWIFGFAVFHVAGGLIHLLLIVAVISLITFSAVIGLAVFVSVSVWLVLAAIMLAMLKMVGREHPPVRNEYEPVGSQRVAIAVLALIILTLCFTPAPFSL